jgi:hypothetical protein
MLESIVEAAAVLVVASMSEAAVDSFSSASRQQRVGPRSLSQGVSVSVATRREAAEAKATVSDRTECQGYAEASLEQTARTTTRRISMQVEPTSTQSNPSQQEGAPGAGVSVPQGSPTCTVSVGRYILGVGAPQGTSISLSAQPREEDPGPLARALKHGGADGKLQRADGGQLADAVGDASELAGKVERAVALFNGVTQGQALDPKQLSGEIDALLGLLERLDRDGRWDEALRLARALSGLLALLVRWVELVRSLNVALHAAQRLGDLPAVAWARHELGTLRLAVEDVSGAERELGEAREIRHRLGDRRGLAATDRNLQALCRKVRQLVRDGKLAPRGRSLRVLRFGKPLAIAAAVLLLAGSLAGVGIGLSDGPEAGGDALAANEQRGSGGGDNPGGDRDNPGGDRDNPGGDRDNPGGDRDNPGGDRDDPSGDRDNPGDDRDDPSDDRDDPSDGGDDRGDGGDDRGDGGDDPGDGGDDPGDGGDDRGDGGDDPGDGGDPGDSDGYPGDSGGDDPGDSGGDDPGDSGGDDPGDSGAHPGDSGGGYPGDSGGGYPGDSGAYPGDSGAYPGDSGAYPGDSGSPID